jgi:hypothetical protein
MLSVMTQAHRSTKRARRYLPGRLLIAAALLAGLFGMHGLTSTPSSPPLNHGASTLTAAMMHTSDAGMASAGLAAGVSAVSEAAVSGMPMPGGHGSHDMLHACVAVLTALLALVALALLAAALARARTLTTQAGVTRARSRRGGLAQRRKPRSLSVTQLCISRT